MPLIVVPAGLVAAKLSRKCGEGGGEASRACPKASVEEYYGLQWCDRRGGGLSGGEREGGCAGGGDNQRAWIRGGPPRSVEFLFSYVPDSRNGRAYIPLLAR